MIHLAALSNDPLGALDPSITYAINHTASVRPGPGGQGRRRRRFLYASTCSVYGAAGESLVDETAELHPVTPYAVSKVKVEEDLHALADDAFTPVYLRNATAFGFSPRLRADIVLNNLVGVAPSHRRRITVLSDGTPWRPLVHAEDIATAFEQCLTAPREAVHDQAFNVGDEKNNVTVAEIAEHVAAGGARLRARHHRRARRRPALLPRRLRQDPRCPAAVAGPVGHRRRCRELATAYAEHGLTERGFGHDHVRLQVLTERQEAGEIDAEMRPVVASGSAVAEQ